VQLNSFDISWLDCDRWSELRADTCAINVYFIDSDALESVFVLVLPPLNHFFNSFPRCDISSNASAAGMGSKQSYWMRGVMFGTRNKLLKEIKKCGAKPTVWPRNLLAYTDTSDDSKLCSFSLLEIKDYAFRSFVVPKGEVARTRFIDAIRLVLLDRKKFACGPISHDVLHTLRPDDIEGYFLTGIPLTAESRAFMTFGEGFAADVRRNEEDQRILMENFVAQARDGLFLRYDDLSPAICEPYVPRLSFVEPDRIWALSRSGRAVETISTLRLSLVKTLGWPIFYFGVQRIMGTLYRRHLLSDSTRDQYFEAKQYLADVESRYETYETSPLESIWD
jgi:hypothetical protein